MDVSPLPPPPPNLERAPELSPAEWMNNQPPYLRVEDSFSKSWTRTYTRKHQPACSVGLYDTHTPSLASSAGALSQSGKSLCCGDMIHRHLLWGGLGGGGRWGTCRGVLRWCMDPSPGPSVPVGHMDQGPIHERTRPLIAPPACVVRDV